MDTLTAIHSLKDLEPDWDSYGATAPDEPTLERAVVCFRNVVRTLGPEFSKPEIRPIPDPGVSFTWRDRWYRCEVKLLVTPTALEWVQLKNRHIVEHGAISDPMQFEKFAHRVLYSLTP